MEKVCLALRLLPSAFCFPSVTSDEPPALSGAGGSRSLPGVPLSAYAFDDPAGTVRRSPTGVVAVRSGDKHSSPWLANVPRNGNHWLTSAAVQHWEIVYTPPTPPGRVLYRDVVGTGGPWEIAVSTESGWVWVNARGLVDSAGDAPYDDEDGAWSVVRDEGFSNTW